MKEDKMKIRKGNKKDIIESANLARNTFKKFNINEGTKKGIKEYLEYYNTNKNLKKIEKSFSKNPLFFVATEKDKLIGVIRGRKNKITNIFIKKEYHNKGLGKKLIEKFEKEAKKQRSKEIKVRASLYSIPFYNKAGYKKTAGIKKIFKGGLRIQPMKKELK